MATRVGTATVHENGRIVVLWKVRDQDAAEICGRCDGIIWPDDIFTRGPGRIVGEQRPNAPVCRNCRAFDVEVVTP